MSKKVKKREVQAPNRLCQTDRDQLIRCMKKDGCISYELLAEQFGITASRVGQIAQEEGLPSRALCKFTDAQVKEIRRRYHTEQEPFLAIAGDFPWATPDTVRSAALGRTYKHVWMPRKTRKTYRDEQVRESEKKLINLALVFSTGVCSIDDLAEYFDVPLGTVQSQFHHLRKKGYFIPRFNSTRKGLPDFDQFDMYDFMCFLKKHHTKIRRGKSARDKTKRKE